MFDCEISTLEGYIGKGGVARGQVSIPNPEVGSQLRNVIGGEGRTLFYIYFDDEVWWGGFLDNTTVIAGGGMSVLQFAGSSFEAYPARREARTDKTYTNADQTLIFKECWDAIQADPGGNLQIRTDDAVKSTIPRTIEWKRSEVRKYSSIIDELSNRVDGFEWVVDITGQGGQRIKRLTTGFPELGRPESGIILTYPGEVFSYSIEGDATEGATSFQARGKAPDPVGTPNPANSTTAKGSEARDPIMSAEHTNKVLQEKGYVRVDATLERSDVTSVAQLNEWAKVALLTRSGPLVLPEITCYPDHMNRGVLGSTITIRISDYAYPPGPYGEPGWEGTARVIGFELDPGEEGQPDYMRLIFEDPHLDVYQEGDII